jgi:hypothetical protein
VPQTVWWSAWRDVKSKCFVENQLEINQALDTV